MTSKSTPNSSASSLSPLTTPFRRSTRIATTTTTPTSLSLSLSKHKRGGAATSASVSATAADADSDSDLSDLDSDLSDIGSDLETHIKSKPITKSSARKRKLPLTSQARGQQAHEPPAKKSRRSLTQSRLDSDLGSATTPLRRRSSRFLAEEPPLATVSQGAASASKGKGKSRQKQTTRLPPSSPSSSPSVNAISPHKTLSKSSSSASANLSTSTPKATASPSSVRARATTRRTRSSSSASLLNTMPSDPSIHPSPPKTATSASSAADPSAMDVDPPAIASSTSGASSASGSAAASAPAAGDAGSPTTAASSSTSSSATPALPLSPLSALAAALNNASASSASSSSSPGGANNSSPSSPNSILAALLNSASSAAGGGAGGTPLSPTSQSNANAALLAAMQQAAATAGSSYGGGMFGGGGGRFPSQIRQLATTFKSLATHLSQAEDPTELYMALQQIPELVLMNSEDTLAGVCMCTQGEYAAASATHQASDDDDADADEDDEDDEVPTSTATAGPRNVLDHLVRRLVPLIAPTGAPTSDGVSELAFAMLGTEVAVLAVRCVKALLDALPGSGIAMLVRNRAPDALVVALGDVQYMDAADGVVDVVHHLVTGGVDGAGAAAAAGGGYAGGAARSAQAALVDAGVVPVLVKYLDFLPLPSQRRALLALGACISSAAGARAFVGDRATWRAVLHLVSAPDGVVDAQVQKAAVGVWMNVVRHATNVSEALMPPEQGDEEGPLQVLAKLVRDNKEVTAALKVACQRDAAARAANPPSPSDSAASKQSNMGVAHALVQQGVLDLLLSPPAGVDQVPQDASDDQQAHRQPLPTTATKFTLTADHIALLTALVDAEVQSTPGSAGNADRAAQLVHCLLDMPDEVPAPAAVRPTFASFLNRGTAVATPAVAAHWSLLLHVIQRAVQAGNAGVQVISPALIDRVVAAIARGTVPRDHALPLLLVDAEPERCLRHGLVAVEVDKEASSSQPVSPKSPSTDPSSPATTVSVATQKKRMVRIDALPPTPPSAARIAALTAWEFMHLPWVQTPQTSPLPTDLSPEDVQAAHKHIHTLIARHLTQLPLVFDPRVSLRGPGGALVSSQGGASGEVTPEIVLVGVRVNVVAPVTVAERMGMGIAFGMARTAAAGGEDGGGMSQSEVESEDDHHDHDDDDDDDGHVDHSPPDVHMDEDGELDDEFDAAVDGDGDIAMHDVLPASASEAEEEDEVAGEPGQDANESGDKASDTQATEAVPDLGGAAIEPPTTPIIPADELAAAGGVGGETAGAGGDGEASKQSDEEVEQVVEMGPFQIQAVARIRDVYRSLGIDMNKWMITHDGRALDLDDAVFRPLWEHVQRLHRDKLKAEGKPLSPCPTEDVFRKQFRFQVVAKDKLPAVAAAATKRHESGGKDKEDEAQVPPVVAQPMCSLLECAARLNAQYDCLGARPSAALVRHVQRQMNQVLLASTQAQPEWLTAVVQGHLPFSSNNSGSTNAAIQRTGQQQQESDTDLSWRFLVPFATRRHYYACHCLGYARCLLRVAPQASRLGKIPRQKVRIDRPHILSSAYRTFDLFGAEYSMLEIEYRGEVGTGLGPTLEFYSLTVQEIANRKDLWQSAAVPFLLPRGASVTDADVDQVKAESDKPQAEKKLVPKDKLTHAHILFLLGQVMAKALMDDRTVDVPLHPTFLKLVFAQPLPLPSTPDSDNRSSVSATATMDNLRAIDPVVAKSMRSVLDMADPSALHLHFEYDGMPLIPGGENKPVETAEDARRYVALVANRIAGVEGLGAAARCVRLGFERVLPVAPLASLFSASELLTLFSGSVTEDNQYWTHQELLATGGMQADHGYSLDSPAVRWLVDWMVGLPASDRRTFLTFLTGAPRLPLGGWKALRPKFTVVHRSAPDPDTYLPSVMTCANYLKMPSYSSRELLDQRMRMAMAEGQGSFHLS